MKFIGDLLGKYVFSEKQDTDETNDKNNEIFTDADETQSVATKPSDSSQSEGLLSSVAEGLNSIVTTLRTSVSDHGRRFSLFDGSTTKTMSTSECLQQSGYASRFDGNCIGSFGFVIPRRRVESCGARPCQAHGSENLKFGNGEKALNLRRSRATNNLNSHENALGSQSSSRSNSVGSLHVKKRGPTCVIEEPSLHEENEHEPASLDKKQDKPSFRDIFRNNLNTLEKNIVLRHRRYKRRAKRQHLADIYRKKYNTEASESSKANELKEESATDGKSKGISRLFNFVRTKFTTQPKSRTDTIRMRVAIKMEKRKDIYKGQSRAKIRAHFRGKYLHES